MSNGCVNLAIISCSSNKSAVTALLDEWVQETDRTESAKRQNPVVARRFLVGRSLVRALVDRTTGSNGRQCQITTDSNGKPFVTLADRNPGPAISISNSGDLVAAAATGLGALGIDVEHQRQHRSFNRIASFAFGPREVHAAGKSPRDFYKIWCLREAMSKASGMGLAEAADGVDRVQGTPDDDVWQMVDGKHVWLCAHFALPEDYSLAVAVLRPASADALEWTEKSLDLRWL